MNLYDEITAKIIDAIEAGTAPWQCPWNRDGDNDMPSNHQSGNEYHGINVLVLWMSQHFGGYSSSRWLTYKQAQAMGGQVRKGSKGTKIIYYQPLEIEKDNGDTETIPMLKGYTVFNLDQIDGIERPDTTVLGEGFDPIAIAEEVMQSTGISISEGGTRAYYRPSTDEIQMPDRERFSVAEDFYATALHEITHATKHASRCDRPTYKAKDADSQTAYAFEELVAEIGAAMLMGHYKLSGEVKEHASYIAHWLQLLRNDKRAIFKAAAQAQKAADWVIQAHEGEQEKEQAA
jgi:antirestriction protein ArdC